MKHILHLLLALAILGGAWIYQFGPPDALFASEIGQDDTTQADGPARGQGGGRNRESAATVVVAEPLSVAEYVDVLQALGTANAINSATVMSETSGRVTASNLSPNADVVAGEMLLQLDARAEEIGVEIATLSLAEAERTVARYDSLNAGGNSVVTDVTLAEAQTAAALAEAELRQAQAALDDRTVRAPISGRLGLSDISVGDVLSSGDVVVHIEDTAAVIVSFALPERAIPLLATENTILASTPSLPGRIFDGVIAAYDNRLDETTRSVTVEARIANNDGILWPGMTFAVLVEHMSDPLTVVPGTALTWDRTGPSIWTVRDGVAEPVPVVIHHRQGDQVWIDLDTGADALMVITEGAHKLRSGSRVAVASDQDVDPIESNPPAESSDLVTGASL